MGLSMLLAFTLHVAVHWWLGGIRCVFMCVFNAFRGVDETAVAFELLSRAHNLDPRFILQKLGGRNEQCQTHAFAVPFSFAVLNKAGPFMLFL